jgi:hypothetical protein
MTRVGRAAYAQRVRKTWLSDGTRRGWWRLKGFADRLCEAGHDLAARTAAALRRAEAGGQWGSGPEGGNALDPGFIKDMSVNLQVCGAPAPRREVYERRQR